ncbi:hypothetical protein G3M48_007546 [Beauveria asiatica]|uniref:Uncharacterized protein n=1 Tax=Beauveria asiatica TaxID=1069075 RepID=A0AAW0S439_9HYPO
MPPFISRLVRRTFDFGIASREFSDQFKNPSDIFSVLLLLGGASDPVGRALAQISGSRVTPVAFSFGWVSFMLEIAVGEMKLMPRPDYACKVINTDSRQVTTNSSWILGRIMRDFEFWMDSRIRDSLHAAIESSWESSMQRGRDIPKPTRVGLCVSIYKADGQRRGAGRDSPYWSGVGIIFLQLIVAVIALAVSGDWSILLIFASGTLLAMSTGSLGQWSREKWACRKDTRKNFVLSQGNGSQHAIVIIGDDKGLDLEDLAMGLDGPRRVPASLSARITVMVLALLWLFLLITATGIKQHTWFILAIGFLGILGNTHVAGANRRPEMQVIPLIYESVICETKVMATLLKVEREYPKCGICMVNMFFPGKLRPAEEDEWAALDQSVDERYKAWKEARRKN